MKILHNVGDMGKCIAAVPIAARSDSVVSSRLTTGEKVQ